MAGSLVQTRLQARGLGSGSPWTIERRDVTYTITATSCTYDDPADGLASPAPADVCLPAADGIGGDSNGDDFRRTTFRVSWRDGGRPRSATYTMLVANPSGGLGPRIVGFTPVTQTITDGRQLGDGHLDDDRRADLRWVVDDGAELRQLHRQHGLHVDLEHRQRREAGSAAEVLDGTYQIIAQPFDDRDIAGEVKRANVVLNRRAAAYGSPAATTRACDDIDTHVLGDWVDLQWAPTASATSSAIASVAGRSASGATRTTARSARPPLWADAGRGGDELRRRPSAAARAGATYHLVAIYRAHGRPAARRRPRDAPSALPAARPAAPTVPLTIQTVGEQPKLSWSAPPSGTVSLYRVYRDGTAFASRPLRPHRRDVATLSTPSAEDGRPPLLGHRRRRIVQRVQSARPA